MNLLVDFFYNEMFTQQMFTVSHGTGYCKSERNVFGLVILEVFTMCKHEQRE